MGDPWRNRGNKVTEMAEETSWEEEEWKREDRRADWKEKEWIRNNQREEWPESDWAKNNRRVQENRKAERQNLDLGTKDGPGKKMQEMMNRSGARKTYGAKTVYIPQGQERKISPNFLGKLVILMLVMFASVFAADIPVVLNTANIAMHNTESDCWMIIDVANAGSVYNLSGFASTHPGGTAFVPYCGTNGTAAFEAIGHDAAAMAMLAGHYMGMLGDTVMVTDITAPTVSLTAPLNGSTVSGNVTINASASDTYGIAGVQFMADGTNIGSEDTQAPYSVVWDTSTASNQSHEIVAVARDNGNNTANATIMVMVNNTGAPVNNSTPDTTPPTISFVSPINGSIIDGLINITVSVFDNVFVAGVKFAIDGVNMLPEVLSSPFTYVNLNTTQLTNGNHTISATARDSSNNTASAEIVVAVNNTNNSTNTTGNNSTVDLVPPMIAISASPANPTVGQRVSISANASDESGIKLIQIFVDGRLKKTCDMSASCSIVPRAFSPGAHTYYAVAIDNSPNANSAMTPAGSFNVGKRNTGHQDENEDEEGDDSFGDDKGRENGAVAADDAQNNGGRNAHAQALGKENPRQGSHGGGEQEHEDD